MRLSPLSRRLERFVSREEDTGIAITARCFFCLIPAAALAVVLAFLPRGGCTPLLAGVGQALIMLGLLFEIYGYLFFMAWFIVARVIEDANTRVARLVRFLPDYYQRVKEAESLTGDHREKYISRMAGTCSSPEFRAYSAIRHYLLFPILGARLIAAFTLVTFAMIVFDYHPTTAGQKKPTTSLKVTTPMTPASVLQLIGSLVYFHIVTVSTTGFGDISPVRPLARLITSMEIVLTTLTFAFIANVIVSTVAGGAALSNHCRIKKHFEKAIMNVSDTMRGIE